MFTNKPQRKWQVLHSILAQRQPYALAGGAKEIMS